MARTRRAAKDRGPVGADLGGFGGVFDRLSGGPVVLGLDLSFRARTGWCLLDEGGAMLGCGWFRISVDREAEHDVLESLIRFRDRVREALRAAPVVLVGYERVNFHPRGTNAAQLYGAAEGILLLTCADEGVPTHPCSVQAIKKAAAGNASVEKPEVIRAANAMWGLNLAKKDHDVADAVWCAEVARRKRVGARTVQGIVDEDG